MIKDFYIFQYDFNDPIDITDESDFDFWMTVNVGDGVAGAFYQVRVCTPQNLKSTKEKEYFFILNYWEGEEKLIEEMNAFIEKIIPEHSLQDPYYLLSKHWFWEYEGM